MALERNFGADDLQRWRIPVFEPFADFLQGSPGESNFEISLLDVVRFAGHACPAMVGAFLMTRKAVRELYPESGVAVRGDLLIDLPSAPAQGATGPIANVFSYITGAWSDTGFGGLNGRFVRRGLLRFQSPAAPAGGFRFTRVATGVAVDVFYDPNRAEIALEADEPFQARWRKKIEALLENPEAVLSCRKVESGDGGVG